MTHQWDEFSKSLSEAVPRRQQLRLLGAAIAGAVFSPLGSESLWGGNPDPCKAFCQCSNKQQQNQCLSACRACNSETSRLAGSCGRYVCCTTAACNGACSDLKSDPNCGACGNDCRDFGETCCGSYCADLESDFYNCGSCGFRCPAPGAYEFGECIAGGCHYACVEGADTCNGTCTSLDSDPNNCGACGHVCPGPNAHCSGGVCGSCVGSCPEGWCGGDGCGGECGCPSGFICVGDGLNMCVPEGEPCPGGGTRCNGGCTNLSFDTLNCGACGNVCAGGETCSGGVCQSPF